MQKLLVVLMLLGCREPDPSEPLPFLKEVRRQPTVHVGDVWFSFEPCGEEIDSAPITITDLFLCATWDEFGRHETHSGTIYLYSPQGALWTSGTIAAPVGWVSIPIGGTAIADRQLIGTWTAQAILDDGVSSALGSVELTL